MRPDGKYFEGEMKENKRVLIPQELCVEISNARDVLISGCGGIIGFSDTEIGVSSASRPVWVRGEKLALSWAGEGRLMIKGRISSVEFGREK